MTGQISYKSEVLRKSIHLSSLWMVVAIYFLEHNQSIILFSLIFIGMVLFEVLRRKSDVGHRLTHKLMGGILRGHEDGQGTYSLTGAFYVCLAVLMALILFSKAVVISAVSIMLLCDTAAALIGRKFGKHKILDKSMEGSTAFFIVAMIILLLSSYWEINLKLYEMVIVALGATLIELLTSKIKMDDNISIVLGAGALMTILMAV